MALLSRCRKRKVLIHVIAHDHTYSMANGGTGEASPRTASTVRPSGEDSQRIQPHHQIPGGQGQAARAPHLRVRAHLRRRTPGNSRHRYPTRPRRRRQEIFTRIAAGIPIKAMADDLTARKSRPPQGRVGALRGPEDRPQPRLHRQAAIQGPDVRRLWPPPGERGHLLRRQATCSRTRRARRRGPAGPAGCCPTSRSATCAAPPCPPSRTGTGRVRGTRCTAARPTPACSSGGPPGRLRQGPRAAAR